MADTAKPMTKPGSSTGCACGIKGCQGHEIRDDGTVHIPNHPRGYLIIKMGGERAAK